MASFIRQNKNSSALYIKIGKRDDVDMLERALSAHGVRVDCACDIELLCYSNTYRTDAQWRDLLKGIARA